MPNTLSGDGNIAVDVTFESMDDFSPAAIAKNVEPLRKLLETRNQLMNLMTYMDGKDGAEGLINKLLKDPALVKTLSSIPKSKEQESTKEAESTKEGESTDE